MNTNKQTETPTPLQPELQEPRLYKSPQQFICLAARALCSRRFVLPVLGGLLVLQLVLLIFGVVQRLYTLSPPEENEALRRELELSRLQTVAAERRAAQLDKALTQAVDFVGTLSGSAGLGGNPGASVSLPEQEDPSETEVTDHNAPPPLRAADYGTLVYEETGVVIEHADAVADTTESDTPEDKEAKARLKAEDAEDLDRLIRQGIAALVKGDMRRCILSFEEASLISADHPALLYYYGMAYDKLLNPEKAREYYTRVFNMRSSAGAYFDRASRRLKHGFEQPSDLRGKVSFGPYTHSHTTDPESGERVSMRLPILVAPETDLSPQDIFIHIQFFVLVNDRKIRYSPTDPTVMWENETQDWSDNEENILISYNLPPLTREEKDAYGEMTYYGFTAKFFYKGEPIDCISNPSALILHEQLINAREATRKHTAPASLLPDDGLALPESGELPALPNLPDLPETTTEEPADNTKTEAATPFAEFIEEIDPSTPEENETADE